MFQFGRNEDVKYDKRAERELELSLKRQTGMSLLEELSECGHLTLQTPV